MKRKTALKNLKIIINRIRAINGIFATPKHNFEALKVKRVWVFGSVAKGSLDPNDIDLFVELKGFRRDIKPIRREFGGGNTGRFKLDYAYYRNHGMYRAKQSDEAFIKWLRKDLRKISIHLVGDDEIFNQIDEKILIYPRCDFNFNDGM